VWSGKAHTRKSTRQLDVSLVKVSNFNLTQQENHKSGGSHLWPKLFDFSDFVVIICARQLCVSAAQQQTSSFVLQSWCDNNLVHSVVKIHVTK
jgi:hypothetical protein